MRAAVERDDPRFVDHFIKDDHVARRLNDLVQVGGDLTLDGTLDVSVSSGGTFDPGIYRIIGYNGALTDNGLAIGADSARARE